jgi:hypothetical protein
MTPHFRDTGAEKFVARFSQVDKVFDIIIFMIVKQRKREREREHSQFAFNHFILLINNSKLAKQCRATPSATQ